MVTHVTTARGKTAAVLDEGDLSAAKDWFIKWMLRAFVTALVAAGSLAAYTVRAEQRDEASVQRDDALLARADSNSAGIARSVQTHTMLIREVDSTRIELRHIADALNRIERKIDRAGR